MAIDVGGRAPVEWPKGLVIKEASNTEELKTWSSILVKSFEIDGPAAEPFGQYFASASIDSRRERLYYTSYMDGVPVAVASLFKGKEAAGIFYVGTLPQYRGNGIGKAMTGHLVNEAREQGYGISTLNASRMGYPLYLKLGFKEYYRTRIFQWP